MSLPRQIIAGLRALGRPAAADRDVADEVDHYLAEAAAAYRERGLSEEAAQLAARRDMGSRTAVRQQVRSGGWEMSLESTIVDLRRAVRRLRRTPAFAAIAAATLALGIGASTAMFSVARPVLLQSLPYPDADRLVLVADAGGDNGAPVDVTFGTFREVAARSRTLDSTTVTRPWQPTLSGHGDAERLEGQSVSAGYFRVLGVAPALGREFTSGDDRPGAPLVAIITDGLWRRRFGADANLLGRTVSLDGEAVTVVGVMPRTFENVWSPQAQIWRPLGYDPSLPPQGREWGHHLQMLARLRAGSTLDAARAELASIARTPAPQFTRPAWAALDGGFAIVPLHDRVTAAITPVLRGVTAATLLLLAIAAVNIVNLMLARGAERRAELTTAAALGASRTRLLAPLLAEGLVLAAIGGTLGAALAYVIVDALLAMDGFALPRLDAIRVDRTALAFAALVSLSIGVVAGCIPAITLSSGVEPTRSDPRVVSRQHRLRRGFVAAEIALAMVLLVGAGLLVRSVRQLTTVPAGFVPERLLTLQVQASGFEFRSPDEIRGFFERVRTAVSQVPGVASAALTSQLPLSGDADVYGVGTRDDSLLPPGADAGAFRYAISGEYLEAMGIALARGRPFDDNDRSDGSPVALVSSSVARRRFQDRDPIGQQLRLGPPDNWFTVVGIVDDVKQSSLASASTDAVYVPAVQWRFADRAMWVVVRTTMEPVTIAGAVRQAIRDVDGNQPVSRLATMDQRIAASMARERLVMGAFNAFAVAALLLAAIGIYGVLAGGVVERTREIAIRGALGASRAGLIGQVGRQAIGMAALGLTGGGAAAAAMSRALDAMLFEVSPLDTVTYVGVAGVLLVAASISAIVPAWRAVRIAPAIALRT